MWASFVNSRILEFLIYLLNVGVFCEFVYFEIFKYIC